MKNFMKKLLENRLMIAQVIALAATVCSVVGLVLQIKFDNIDSGMTWTGLGVLISLISYIFGGLLTAIKMAWEIAKWGWVAAPFPLSIASGILTFGIGLIVFVAFPIIPIRKAYKKKMIEC